jgi:parallel beta-helix repeat protein
MRRATSSSIMIVSLTLMAISMIVLPSSTAANTPHSQIIITGNSEFTIGNGVLSGDGTAGSPFVISGWDVATGSSYAIFIRNTTAFFILENISIQTSSFHSGIGLSNVTNGLVRNITCTGNGDLLYATQLTYCDVVLNNVTGGGIGISDSSNCTAMYNTMNSASGGSLFFHSSENCSAIGDDVAGSNFGIILDDSHDCTAMLNNASGCNDGIYLSNSFNCSVFRNRVHNSTYEGIWLDNCYSCIVSQNWVYHNLMDGFILSGCTGVKVYHNSIIQNTNQAFDNSFADDNYWDNGYPSGGNYWSNYGGVDLYSGPNQNIPGADGIGDTSFFFGRDRYPLMGPRLGNTPPIANFTVAPLIGWINTNFSFDASSSQDSEDPVGVLEVRWDWENDSLWDTAWSTTKIAYHVFPVIGAHTIRLDVKDSEGAESNTTRVISVVEDTTAPVTNIGLSGTKGNDWYRTSVSVSFSASDSLSGVNWTRYRINASAWENFSSAFSIVGNGNHTIDFYSCDFANNSETYKSTIVRIDKIEPQLNGVTVEVSLRENRRFYNATISWNGSDSISGIDHYEISVDGGPFISLGTTNRTTLFNLTATVEGDHAFGEHTVIVRAVDKAGNIAETTVTPSFDVNEESHEVGIGLLAVLLFIVALAAIGIVIFLILSKRKKSEDKPPKKAQ